jgi:hypothetical protein
VDPRAGLDDVEKRKFLTLPGFELRSLGRPASNQSLYRLRYHQKYNCTCDIVLQIVPLKPDIQGPARVSFAGRPVPEIGTRYPLCKDSS